MRQQSASPNITVRAVSGAEGYRLELKGAGDPKPLHLPIHEPQVLRSNHARFNSALERAKTVWRSDGALSAQRAGAALLELADAGRTLLTRALVWPTESLPELHDGMRRWCPSLRLENGRIPLLYIEPGAAQFLPWEVLPLFDLNWDGSTPDLNSLREAALAFPGFGAVVERGLVSATTAQSPCLTTENGRLPIRFLWDAKYPGAQGELGFFRSRPVIRLEGPSPADGDPLPGPETMARHIADPGLGLDGRAVEHPYQILHMSCHCVARPGDGRGDPGDFSFHLATEEGESVEIPVEKILGKLALHWTDRARRTADKPFVFLNACATSVYDPWSLASVLEPFHKNQNRGVITTAANLPDRLADGFSRRFYHALLTGATAGEALHAAKWHLLDTMRDPTGLLYCLHGVSSLQVAPLPSVPAAVGDTTLTRT
ncbi:CHAT domain-containing protein [Streptomyces sp. NBC_01485]|uniref:CHAT domain-containing protein n=1 Tax=Streptomyces sp. NBC_01485 TaxID=2903884 RepID=UPI002E30CABA|nr:CHAT domain-containing protein [Streptomyces sp. NBC_01485]